MTSAIDNQLHGVNIVKKSPEGPSVPFSPSWRKRLLLPAFLWAGGVASALAQAVSTTGDVSPSPAITPVWDVNGVLTVGSAGAGTLSISSGGQVIATAMYVGIAAGSSGEVMINDGGVLTLNGTGTTPLIGKQGSGKFTMNGGFFSGTGLVAGTTAVGGEALVTINSGTLQIGSLSAGITGGQGEVVLNGGSNLGTFSISVGAGGTGTMTFNGGNFNLSSVLVGRSAGTNGSLTITGGSVSSTGITMGQQAQSAGAFNVQGGEWNITGSGDIGIQGGATVELSRTGTLTVGGGSGTLRVATGTSSAATINIGASDLSAPTAGGTLSAGAIVFGAGSGTMNFNQNNRFALGASISGGGQLVQRGSGTTVLSGSNSYLGGTVISGGTLLLTNTAGSGLGSGAAEVRAGATLGGTGLVALGGANTLAVKAGGALAPGEGLGTLSLSGADTTGAILSMESGASILFNLASGNLSSSLSFLSYAGAADFVHGLTALDFTNAQEGTYTLFTFYADGGTTLTDAGFDEATSDFVLGTGLAGYDATWDYSQAGEIRLTLTSVPEPSALALLAVGAGGLLGRLLVRRR